MDLRRHLMVAALLLAIVLATACVSNTDDAAQPALPTLAPTVAAEPTISPTNVPSPTIASTPTSAPDPTVAPTVEAPTPTPIATSLPTLPGEPFNFFVPERGEMVGVIGVAFDDTLEVHLAPGENTEIVARLNPLEEALISAGEGRQLPSSIWWRVTMDDIDGWVGSRFVTRLGATFDTTSRVVEVLGSVPTAETMVDLGMVVANYRGPQQEGTQTIVITGAPTVGDLGEITIDFIGLLDDSILGERLHVFGQPLENGEGFSLVSVEATIMCRRGVGESGLCT